MHYIAREEEKNVRVKQIQKYDEEHNKHMTSYLREKDMLMDFLTDTKYQNEYKPIKELTQKQLKRGNAREIEYRGKKYLFYTDQFNSTILYEILPTIYDDELFHWSENKKYGTMESIVVLGVFEFLCIYQKANGNGNISVRYTKCDNYHKNKVTIANIEDIYNASNDIFIDAIEQWTTNFMEDVDKIKA